MKLSRNFGFTVFLSFRVASRYRTDGQTNGQEQHCGLLQPPHKANEKKSEKHTHNYVVFRFTLKNVRQILATHCKLGLCIINCHVRTEDRKLKELKMARNTTMMLSISLSSVIPCLHDRAHIEQTSSKHRANMKHA